MDEVRQRFAPIPPPADPRWFKIVAGQPWWLRYPGKPPHRHQITLTTSGLEDPDAEVVAYWVDHDRLLGENESIFNDYVRVVWRGRQFVGKLVGDLSTDDELYVVDFQLCSGQLRVARLRSV